MELRCLTPGWFEFPDGASSSCSKDDVANGKMGWSGYTISLAPGQDSVTIKTDPGARWQLTAEYVKQERTPLGVNAKGETYGVERQENGTPRPNRRDGHERANRVRLCPGPLRRSHAHQSGRRRQKLQHPRPPREIPVFQSDGETQIGVFRAAGSGGGIPSYPTKTPRQGRRNSPSCFLGGSSFTNVWNRAVN